MVVLYVATAAMGGLGTSIAIAMIGIKSVLDAWWLLSGVFAGGLLGLFLLGMIAKKATKPAAVTAVLIGLAVIIWMSLPRMFDDLPPALRNPLHANMTIVVGTLTIFFVGLISTRAFEWWGGQPGLGINDGNRDGNEGNAINDR